MPTPKDAKEPVAAPSADATKPDVKEAAAPAEVDSSSAEANEPTLLEAVTRAVSQTDKKEDAVEKVDSDGEQNQEAADAEDAETKVDEAEEPAEEAKDETEKAEVQPPFHEHPRWKQVMADLKTAKAEVDTLKPVVERAKAIDEYRSKYGITDEQFTQALEVAALLNVNPAEARKRLQPFIDSTAAFVGERLPDDIAKKLEDGVIDADTARELAQSRAQSKWQTEAAERLAKQQHQAQVNIALGEWERAKRTADTAFAQKYPLIEATFMRMITANPARTPADVVALAEKAYEEVTQTVTKLVPAPKAAKVLKSDGSSNKAATAKPQTIEDVVKQTLARHRYTV